MSEQSNIAWCDATAVIGCDKVSADPSEWPEDLRVRQWPK